MAEKKEVQKAVKQPKYTPTANPPEKIKVNKTDDSSGKEEKESYLKDLMAISGHGGLFRFVSQGRNGIIVESIETGKRMQAFATMKISSLDDIAIYTSDEEVQFEKVVASIYKYENGKESISPKSDPDELKEYFSAILPEYDRDRVYVSDIKKILYWYNLLLKYDLIEIGGKKTAAKSEPKEEAKASPEKSSQSTAEKKAKSTPEQDAKSTPEKVTKSTPAKEADPEGEQASG